MGKAAPLFADLDLARRLERAEGHANARFVEARARLEPESGACWKRIDGTYAMFDGVDSPITQTFGLGLLGETTADSLDEIERFFTSHGAPMYHEASPLMATAVVEELCHRDYQPIEFSSVLYRPIAPELGLADPVNEAIAVRTIAEGEGSLWSDITVRGWSHIPELESYLRELGPISTAREDGVSVLAELDGRPIAAGAMSLADGVCLLAGACTVPEARRQGAQLALLDYRLRHATGHGCDLAMMCAQPGSASQRNAERHGFRIAYTRIKWGRER